MRSSELESQYQTHARRKARYPNGSNPALRYSRVELRSFAGCSLRVGYRSMRIELAEAWWEKIKEKQGRIFQSSFSGPGVLACGLHGAFILMLRD